MYCDYLSSVFSDTWPSLFSFIVTLMHTFFLQKNANKKEKCNSGNPVFRISLWMLPTIYT